jgi:hypothetical protein
MGQFGPQVPPGLKMLVIVSQSNPEICLGTDL